MKKRLLIMAAGTGGHIFPGLAIAETMRARGWEISWLGMQRGMEQGIVPRHHIELDAIDFSGLRGKGKWHAFTGIIKMLKGFWRCLQVLRTRKPDMVLGMGGYVAVPGGVAAKMVGIPLVLVNADATLLMSNRFLKPMAKKVLFGFPSSATQGNDAVVVTGNPVRSEIAALPSPAQRFAGRSGVLRILVVGGSLGAQVLNECLPRALALLPQETRPLVVHQSGKPHLATLHENYARAGVTAEVRDFIEDMAQEYARADLVICRAGAITVSELTVAGVASILVPFMVKTTSHQRENALWMAEQKAAIHLPQAQLNAEHLAQILSSLTRASCLEMAQAARACARREANQDIASVLEAYSGAKKETV